MQVEVDLGKCVGHAQCFAAASAVYDLSDEDGTCVIRYAEIPSAHEAEARHGADACPERAITVIP
ncbi:hypothetical protein Z051_08300 [Rhodococcus rhodochrous KG-21]|uniref:Ferredoxin n=2 Tax=Rhodococcus rhodochrous TaxID=1829 RepID=A0A0M9WPJ4_RHORH|nr:hypothetical protein Z051_08300 [Rhodococcus rhodochrous KG-21]